MLFYGLSSLYFFHYAYWKLMFLSRILSQSSCPTRIGLYQYLKEFSSFSLGKLGLRYFLLRIHFPAFMSLLHIYQVDLTLQERNIMIKQLYITQQCLRTITSNKPTQRNVNLLSYRNQRHKQSYVYSNMNIISNDSRLIWSCLLSIKEGTTNAQQNQFNYQ